MTRRGCAGAAALFLLLAGCGTKLDDEYRVASGGIHPFDDTAEHGAYLAANAYAFASCTACHGDDLRGQVSSADGDVVRSCYACHTSSAHQVAFTDAEEEHPGFLRSVRWDLGSCFVCHPDPSRANPSPVFGGSCSGEGCHDAAHGGPVACNVCHGDWSGDPDDPASWAPPASLADEDGTTVPGVGAHQTHLLVPGGKYAAVPCRTCHTVPATWDAAGHLDDTDLRAEVRFGGVASPAAWYDFAASTCTATYCHGSQEPVWNEVDGTWNECGTCHGLPPAGEHAQGAGVEYCYRCHGAVIGQNYVFIAPERHVDGEVDDDDD